MVNPVIVEALGRRRKFSDEKKADIVAEATSRRTPIAQLARDHDISQSLIYKWIRDAKDAAAFTAAAESSPFLQFEVATQAVTSPKQHLINVKIHFPSNVSMEIIGELSLAKIIALGREFGGAY